MVPLSLLKMVLKVRGGAYQLQLLQRQPLTQLHPESCALNFDL